MGKKHVVITGTGRTGTTFIVKLLTYLGLDTGFSVDDTKTYINAAERCGLEFKAGIWDLADAPYIIKSPWFVDCAEALFAREDIQIERIFIPMRDLYAAAESRRYIRGGLWKTDKPDEQENVLLVNLYKLILAISNTDIPITLLQYPRLIRDSLYLYNKLETILNKVPYDEFKATFDEIYEPTWVHDFKKAVNG